MTPEEWWRIYEIRRPRDPSIDYAGSLDEDAIEAMLAEFE